MPSNIQTVAASLAISLVACAAVVPAELADARAAYDRASHGPAAELAPTHLREAKTALDLAERAFGENPRDQATRDLAYMAKRESQRAEMVASRVAETNVKDHAEQDSQRAQAGASMQASADLATSARNASEANRRAEAMAERLADLASVKQDQRGTIVTLSGSVLFPSNKSTLLPAAERRLNQVSDALLSARESGIRVEGYTDSLGSEDANIIFSQERAEAVRSYLVSRGYEAGRIQAYGMGESEPVANNDNAAGRANNRRVELVLKR